MLPTSVPSATEKSRIEQMLRVHSLAGIHELDESVAAISREPDIDGSLNALVEIQANYVVSSRSTSGDAIPRQESGGDNAPVSHFEAAACHYERPRRPRAVGERLSTRCRVEGKSDCQRTH